MGSPPVKGFGEGSVAIAAWAEATFRPEDPVLREIRERSLAAGLPAIAVGTMDGLHLEVLARACGARRAVEIGTLGGYSGVCLLRGMGLDGQLDTFEASERHAAVARESFRRAGFLERVRIHVGRALDRLPSIEGQGPFDLCFIDADKQSYVAYLDWAAEHLRPGGLLLADNAFAFGGIADPGDDPELRQASRHLRAFAERLVSCGRFRATVLPTAEGLAFGVKVR
jgi:caffeoyl-CoA O-methyltransferase